MESTVSEAEGDIARIVNGKVSVDSKLPFPFIPSTTSPLISLHSNFYMQSIVKLVDSEYAVGRWRWSSYLLQCKYDVTQDDDVRFAIILVVVEVVHLLLDGRHIYLWRLSNQGVQIRFNAINQLTKVCVPTNPKCRIVQISL